MKAIKNYRNWIIGIALTAAAGAATLQSGLAPTASTPLPPPTMDTPTQTVPPTAQPCGYMWAYKDAPELGEKIQAAVQGIDPKATARAQAFGEDCFYPDGSAGPFGAMETDVYIRLTVEDLTAQESFGNFMGQTLPLIAQIPESEFPGGYGFVEFSFEKNDAEHIIVRVPILDYLSKAQGKTGLELFLTFYTGE